MGRGSEVSGQLRRQSGVLGVGLLGTGVCADGEGLCAGQGDPWVPGATRPNLARFSRSCEKDASKTCSVNLISARLTDS